MIIILMFYRVLPVMSWGMCDMGGVRTFASKKAEKKPAAAPAKKQAPKVEEEEAGEGQL